MGDDAAHRRPSASKPLMNRCIDHTTIHRFTDPNTLNVNLRLIHCWLCIISRFSPSTALFQPSTHINCSFSHIYHFFRLACPSWMMFYSTVINRSDTHRERHQLQLDYHLKHTIYCVTSYMTRTERKIRMWEKEAEKPKHANKKIRISNTKEKLESSVLKQKQKKTL